MNRSPALTSLRGIAALWVFLYHIPIYVGFTIPLNTPLVSAGYLGVPIFFMLSIFLLLKSLDQNPSLEHYFLRRVKRIWPMYFITVLLVFFYYSHSLAWLGDQFTFSAVFIDNQSIQYVFWTLQIEEVAYLFFPFIQRQTNRNKGIIAGALLGVSVIAFVLILETGTSLELWWLPMSLSSYGFGILVYLRKIPKACLPLILMSLFYWDVRQFEMASFIVAPGFAYVVQESDRFAFLKSKTLVWVGDNSYGLYLIHALLMSAMGWFGVLFALPCAWVFEKFSKAIVRRKS